MGVAMNEPAKHYLTVFEVAGILRVDHRTVRRMLDDGDLPFIKSKGVLRIPANALPGYVPANDTPAESKAS